MLYTPLWLPTTRSTLLLTRPPLPMTGPPHTPTPTLCQVCEDAALPFQRLLSTSSRWVADCSIKYIFLVIHKSIIHIYIQMTTPRLTSTLPSPLTELATLKAPTLLLFPMDVSSMSSTLPTAMMDMSPMSHTRELLSTPRPSPMPPPLLQPTTPKPSLCFVNIY